MKKIIPLAIFLTVVLAFVLIPYLIRVKVECKTQYGACPEDMLKAVQNYQSKNLGAAEHGIGKALKSNPLISDFSMHFKLPDILELNILIKKPVFAVYDRGSGKIGTVAESGRILSISESSPLPQIITNSDLSVGKSVSEQELFALSLMRGVYEMYQVQKGEIVDNSLVVVLPPKFAVTFPLEGDTQVLLGELRLTYAKIGTTDELKSYSQIDLRFKNPVLR